ncbi:MAG TPA: hypothetical protein VFS43_25320 [Polyangiaceae bacterium]|nr:hypothetical protein [Polyangiaceae bacterium]
MPPKANAGAVLAALLEHTDASTIEVLIAAENLLTLLRREGWSDERIKRALKQDGKLPGELLLELFRRGKSASELLAALGPAASAQAAAGRAKAASRPDGEPSPPRSGAPGTPRSGAPPSALDEPDWDEGFARRAVTERVRRPVVGPRNPLRPAGAAPAGPLEHAGLALVLVAGVVPSLLAVIDLAIALAFLHTGPWAVAGAAGALGALGGALFARGTGRLWAGLLGGALAAFGGNAAVVGYTFWGPGAGRDHLLRVELVGTALVGLLPGALLYAALARAGRGEAAK